MGARGHSRTESGWQSQTGELWSGEDDDDSEQGSQDTVRWGTPQRDAGQVYSGSRGMLGEILEKMHRGEILSQHEVSAATRDYNKLNSALAEMEDRTKHLRLQVYQEDPVFSDRPLTGPENITDDTERSLRQQLDRKDQLIVDLQKRLDKLNQERKGKAGLNISVLDLAPPSRVVDNFCNERKNKAGLNISVSDLVPPSRVVDNFCNLFEVQWAYAFESLKVAWKDEERAIHALFRVVRHAYVFCSDLAEAQRLAVDDAGAELQETMLQPAFTHPVSRQKYKPSLETNEETQRCIDLGTKMLQDYRNMFVPRSVPAVQELFRKVKLAEVFGSGTVTRGVRDYADRLLELVWLMVVERPSMVLYWLEPGRTTLPHYFNYWDEKGRVVRQTVWPAVFLKEGGRILSKGVVLATSKQEDLE